MGRSYGNGRTEVYSFRVTPEENARLRAEAAAAGMTPGDYARAKMLAESTPEVLAAAHSITNHLNGLESAIAQAKSALAGRE